MDFYLRYHYGTPSNTSPSNRTVLRELLQNAADASATTAIIKLETIPSTTVPVPAEADTSTLIKHTISHHTLQRLVFRNNGLPFNANDWARLKRIAEGNPDETKIGAFGVGFYSVFSDCEVPFVSSGKEAIAFYWKGNALYTRRLQLDESDASPETSFILDHRNNTTPVPALRPLCEFLASSLTFANLQTIELWLDDWNLLKLSKMISPSSPVSPPNDVKLKTEEGLMQVSAVTVEMSQMDATWMKAVEWKNPATASRFEVMRNNDTTASLRTFFSRLTGSTTKNSDKPEPLAPVEDLTTTIKSSVTLHRTTAHIATSVSQSFSRELERATKKPPPKTTSISLLTTTYTGGDSLASGSDILSAALPVKGGRIYIGFSTHQTTGLNAHIAIPSLIPTVERESIDLNARWVRTWNVELLRAVGIASRIAWSVKMDAIKKKLHRRTSQFGRSKPSMDDISGVLPDAIHVSNQFVFQVSTPAAQVGQIIENAFWTCSKNAYIEVLSTRGVLPSHQVRVSPKDLSFMEGIPALPEQYIEATKGFVKRLMDLGLITDITISDIKQGLETNTISSQQLSEFLSWVTAKAATGQIDRPTVNILLRVAVAEGETTEGQTTGIIVLKDITGYLNPNRIPADLPIPPFVMPFQFTKSVPPDRLATLGWHELLVDAWVKWLVRNRTHLAAEHDMTRTPAFAARVLPVLSRQWDSMEPSKKEEVLGLLKAHTVIPTRSGMRKPGEAYFSSVKLFDDLPVVRNVNGVKEKFLLALGVRKTVELSIIFDRLLNSGPDQKEGSKQWSHVDLIKYLAAVRQDIPQEDIEKLRQARICTMEAGGDSKTMATRHCVSELYEPKDSLRELGLPLLFWPSKYMSGSPEGQFLTLLSLKSFPTAAQMVELMSQGNSGLGEKARGYFISEHLNNNYNTYDYSGVNVPFVPVEGGKLSTPSRCFTDAGSSFFGFDIMRRDLHPEAWKFHVRAYPPIESCVNVILNKPPKAKAEAKTLFEYFSRRLADINPKIASQIGQTAIVPTSRNVPSSEKSHLGLKSSGIRYITPKECYIGNNEEYEDIFDFVDFGEQANLFLLRCGSKRQPTNTELARMLVKEPARVSATLHTHERYLKLLANIADSMSVIRKDVDLFREMKNSPFLLASRELTPKTSSKAEKSKADDLSFEDEDQGIKEWQLVKASDAVIVDDYASYNLFKESVLAAPQDERLESMYMALGTPCLSHLIEEEARCGNLIKDQSAATALQKRIYERSRLFLHDLPSEMVKHDAKWLENRLTLQVVSSISLYRSLRGRKLSHTEKRSAVAIKKGSNWVLYISGAKVDFYQVSQALVHLMLSRAKLHSTLTLEMLLKTDLLELRARGYNVERILRQKAAEARMAESKRQQQLEAEMKQIQELELTRRRAKEEEEDRNDTPGGFPGSPTSDSFTESPGGKGSSFFSQLGKRLGLRDSQHLNDANHPLLPEANNHKSQDPQPPSYTPEDPISVTSHETLQSNLLSAVRQCRPHGSSHVFSRGEKTQVVEKKTYCDERSSKDLAFVANSGNGMKLFFDRSLPDRSKFLEKEINGLNNFASIVADCASIFLVGIESVAIFYDHSKTIAFNLQGSIYCNYLYFQQLHLEQMDKGQRTDALVYWWVIFCHELAHNLVETHNSEHSYYT